jgi:hypothetical protein
MVGRLIERASEGLRAQAVIGMENTRLIALAENAERKYFLLDLGERAHEWAAAGQPFGLARGEGARVQTSESPIRRLGCGAERPARILDSQSRCQKFAGIAGHGFLRHPPSKRLESEYKRHFGLIADQITGATRAFYTYTEINKFASANNVNHQKR